MEQRTFRKHPYMKMCFFIVLLFSVSAFAGNDRASTPTDCVSCNSAEQSGTFKAGKLEQVMAAADSKFKSSEEVSASDIHVYCVRFAKVSKLKDFKQKILEDMQSTSKIGSIDAFWQKSGCETDYIAQTESPIIHLAGDNPTSKKDLIMYLKKIYEEKNDLETFKKILNSKNSKGQTLLDYIQYVYSNKKYIKGDEAALNEFVKFLCENGAVYSKFNKTCPAEYLTI